MMNNKNKPQLITIENIILFETLNFLENHNYHFFKKTSSLLKSYIKHSDIGKYKIQHLDLETLQELNIFLDSQVVERIFIQCYLLLLEWNRTSVSCDMALNKVFSSLGEFRVEQLITLVTKYNNGELSIEQLFPQNNQKVLKTSVKLQAIKLFEMFKSTNNKKVNETKLKKLNKGALNKIWDKVIRNLEIIKNPNTPAHIKAIAIGAIIYVIVPIDAIPDIVPIGGLVDDAAIILLALEQIKVLLKKK